jgi:hypothetical protein
LCALLALVAGGAACTKANPAFRPGSPGSDALEPGPEPDAAAVADTARPVLEGGSPPADLAAPTDLAPSAQDLAMPADVSPDRGMPDVAPAPPPDVAPDQATPVLPGLVGFWHLDDMAPSMMVRDSSPNQYHGTLRGLTPASAWVPGHVGGALLFPENAQAAGVELTANAAIRGLQHFTLSAWTRRTTTDSNRHMTIVSRQLDGTSREVFSLAFDGPDLVLYLYPERPNDTVEIRYPVTNPLNRWIHVAGTYDGINLRLYVAGALVKTQPYTGLLASATATTPVLIGANRNLTGDNQPWEGWLDEVMISAMALPGQTINQLAQPQP